MSTRTRVRWAHLPARALAPELQLELTPDHSRQHMKSAGWAVGSTIDTPAPPPSLRLYAAPDIDPRPPETTPTTYRHTQPHDFHFDIRLPRSELSPQTSERSEPHRGRFWVRRGRSAGTATRAVSRARSLHGRRGRHRHACVLAVAFESRLMRIHYNIAAANVTRGAQWSGAHAT